jgi:RNA polymerase subunit RPABC4/transcription elongation factor Spt4
MSTHFYRSNKLNIEQMVRDLEGILQARGYQTQHFVNGSQIVVQLREGSDIEALLGMQATLGVVLQATNDGVTATAGEQQWVDKAAVGLLGAIVLWPLLVTASVGIIRQASLEDQLFGVLDMVALRQHPDVRIFTSDQGAQFSQPPYPHASNVPPQSGPMPMPGYGQKTCPHCQSINDADDAFCSYCGTAFGALKKRCANCNADLKVDAAFCAKCGTMVAR